MFWTIIKKTFIYAWEELFYLCICNFITFLTLFFGPMLLFIALAGNFYLVPVGLILLLLAPPAIFGLFFMVHEIGQDKAIKLATYFEGAKQFLKPAYIWGGINLVLGIVLIVNIFFYRGFQTNWGIYLSLFFVGITIVWSIVQLLTLPLYPKMITPSFRVAQKNALALIGLRPFPVLGCVLFAVIISVIGFITSVGLAIFALFMIALCANFTTVEILKETQAVSHEPPQSS